MLNFKGSGTYAQIFISYIPKPLNSFFCYLVLFLFEKAFSKCDSYFQMDELEQLDELPDSISN